MKLANMRFDQVLFACLVTLSVEQSMLVQTKQSYAYVNQFTVGAAT